MPATRGRATKKDPHTRTPTAQCNLSTPILRTPPKELPRNSLKAPSRLLGNSFKHPLRKALVGTLPGAPLYHNICIYIVRFSQ